MSLPRRNSTIRRGSQLRRNRRPIKQFSARSISYRDFRNLKLVKDRDDEGLITCQDTQIGLPACGVRSSSPDLHHSKGRDGSLLFDERWLVWLTRDCHDRAHDRDTSSTLPEATDDPQRQVEDESRSPRSEETETASSSTLSPVQGRSIESHPRGTGAEVHSNISRSDAPVMERQKEGAI